jgi:hypothetical protein
MISKFTKRKSTIFFYFSWEHCKEKVSRSVSNFFPPLHLLFPFLSFFSPISFPWFSPRPSPLLSPLLLPSTVPARRPNKSRSGISTSTAPKTASCGPSQNSTGAVYKAARIVDGYRRRPLQQSRCCRRPSWRSAEYPAAALAPPKRPPACWITQAWGPTNPLS